VTNTTFSANTSGTGAAGLCTSSSGVITLTNSTLVSNAASVAGGGVRNLGRLSLRNTIIANSTLGVDCVNVGHARQQPQQPGERRHLRRHAIWRPGARPLADNGGGTLTHALWPNSPAIDAGNDAGNICPATDQRGRPGRRTCTVTSARSRPRAAAAAHQVRHAGQ